jgi:release factor glutamine methyltransferase
MPAIKEIISEYHKKINSLDLELLIAHTIKKPREFVLAHPEYKIPKLKIENLKLKITRRMQNEPLAYIRGYKEFYGLDFAVTKDTLIPRPETEMLVDLALDEIKKLKTTSAKKIAVIDVGTGSGNIIISVIKALQNNNTKFEHFAFYGIDNSAPALKIAKRNAQKHKTDKTIKFLQGDLLKPVTKSQKLKTKNSEFIILANLPYLSRALYKNTSKDVRDFEPKNALISGQKGLAHYYRLIKSLKNTREPQSVTLFLEISQEQKLDLKKYTRNLFYGAPIKIKKDLSGRERVMKIKI